MTAEPCRGQWQARTALDGSGDHRNTDCCPPFATARHFGNVRLEDLNICSAFMKFKEMECADDSKVILTTVTTVK